MRLLAWFLGALVGGGLGALLADLLNLSGTAELIVVVILGLVLAALAEGVVKRRQSRAAP